VLRVGAGGVDLSLSDFVLAAATVPALLMARRTFPPPLRAVLWASAFYQFTTLIAVVNNPYSANAVEWFHTWLMVSGGLLVGWAVGANGYGRIGMRLLVLTIAALALVTIFEGLLHFAKGDFSPVYPTIPFPMHKNFVGTLCGMGAAMVYARPHWAGLSRRFSTSLMTLMIVAVLFTQSRQAVVGLIGAVFVLVLRSNTDRKRSKLLLLLLVPILVGISNVVQDQLKSDNQFNSAQQRLTWFQDSMTIWNTDPWFGVGMRWWYTDRFAYQFQPPNAEIEVLTSAGVLGLIGFVLLMVVAFVVAWRLDPAYGSLAVAVLVSRLVQGQFDLFWSAVQASVPFVVLGLCIGAHRQAGEKSEQLERDARFAADLRRRASVTGP
ncbi:MAG: hypothetical protein JWP82_719, partial [Humibacillus sp.]|nr:hypothetical protein [Humibacillus sp.]